MKRSVAFLDVLGFRRLVETTPADDLGNKFVKLTDVLFQHLNKPMVPNHQSPRLFPEHAPGLLWCTSHVFSDSMILISHDDSESDCLKLLVFVLRAMQVMIASNLPVRGAAAFGEMFVDLDRRLFLGRALTTAYDPEQRQDWIGVTVDESVPSAFPSICAGKNAPILEALFPKYEVPLKSGTASSFRTVNWRWNLVVEKGIRSLFHLPSDWAERRKVLNTLEYARFVRSAGLAYPENDENVPLEVRAFFVGAGPPPPRYQHGDEL